MEKVRYYIGGKGIEFVCENTGKNIFADAIIIFDNRNSKRKIQIDWPSFAESQGVEKFREKIKKLIFSAAGQPCDHLELVFSKRGSDYVPIKEGWRIFVEEMLQMSEQNAF
ncbi:MAG: hypothetical protein NC902_00680, partial [Candidatus Omnitrophica bacterium]|nr:hypothetical protein [Candidatus Omnitrophota bacterium]